MVRLNLNGATSLDKQMEENRAKALIDKYLSGQASEQEKAVVETWFNSWSEEKKGGEITDYVEMNERIMAGLPDGSILRRAEEKSRTWKWLPYAAALLLVASVTFFVYESKDDKRLEDSAQLTKIDDVNPGTKRATLTLADGKTIILDNVNTGRLALVDGTEITKTADGQITYATSNDSENHEVLSGAKSISVTAAKLNTITIPRGGEYQLILPDGTKVWLNAATTIKYPTRFTGKERKIQIEGEAYLEVAKDPQHPFIVESTDQTIEVLGTHFNINTYQAGNTVTTLEEGAVMVSSLRGTKQSLKLKPGQQAINSASLTVAQADLESTLAWKNGLLYFKDAPLTKVLEEISRWYDVDIEYKNTPPAKIFSGGVDRSAKLSSMLKILNLTGVKTELVGNGDKRKLIIE